MSLADRDFKSLYINWLKENIEINSVGKYVEISTPFLDRHNDHLQIYVKQDDNKLFLTDDGYILSDLEMSGCSISTPRRKAALKTILNGAGISLVGDELTTEATIETFASRKHALLQTMLSVNDIFLLAQSNVASIFLEDIKIFLDTHDIRYIASVPLFGKSGLSHSFDFAIPSSRKSPERLVKAVNHLTREKTDAILFSWEDIKETRKPDAVLFAFINDEEKTISQDIENAFTKYGVQPVFWSKRNEYLEKLIA